MNHNYSKLSICIMTLAFGTIFVNAQTLKVEKMQSLTMDLSAATNQRLDSEGKSCALVKVAITDPNATFGGNIIGDVVRNGSDYWVYMAPGSKSLEIRHPNFKNTVVDFANFKINSVEGKQTYILDVNLECSESYGRVESLIHTFKPVTYESGHDFTSDFFPLQDITLGKSGHQDAVNAGLKKVGLNNSVSIDYGFYSMNSVYNDSDVFDRVYLNEIPVSWITKYGISRAMSYNQWLEFFRSQSYRVDVLNEPSIKSLSDVERQQLTAKIAATTPDGSLRFMLEVETYTLHDFPPLDTPNSFKSMEVCYMKNKKNESAIDATRNASDGIEIKESVKRFFPIFGVSLGKSTWKDVYDAGYTVDPNISANACWAYVYNNMRLIDNNKKGYFDTVEVQNQWNQDMPAEWQKLGMSWGNSYENWLKFYEGLGFTVEVLEQPQNKNGYYRGKLVAKSSDGGLTINLNFLGPDGSNETTPGTIYSIEMTAN